MSIAGQKQFLRPDFFGRVPAALPPSLRAACEHGEWPKRSPPYMSYWPKVVELAEDGHALAARAQAVLARISLPAPTGPPAPPARAEHSPAVHAAAAAGARHAGRVRAHLLAQRAERHTRGRRLAREYHARMRAWRARINARRPSAADKAADRALLVGTKAFSGMGTPLVANVADNQLAEIEEAGGTNGGHERWSRSITRIPPQEPWRLRPTRDGGGVLLDDPLGTHYNARTLNPWTHKERMLFLDKFILHGKNFRRVASFFEYKSVEDVVRFYFEHKITLKLKELVRDGAAKRRAAKKITLTALAAMPKESRSIRDNFVHQRFRARDAAVEAEDVTISPVLPKLAPAGRGWTNAEEQALIVGLCSVDVSENRTNQQLGQAWGEISDLVRSKSAAQCREFYDHYKESRGLAGYKPPSYVVAAVASVAPAVITPAKRSAPEGNEPNGRKFARVGPVNGNGTMAEAGRQTTPSTSSGKI